jgi:hypothetical protein
MACAVERRRFPVGARPIAGVQFRQSGCHRASETQQARCATDADLDLDARCSTHCRRAVAGERRTLPGARTNTATAQAENTGGTRFTSGDLITAKSTADDLGGCTLDRPHEPRTVWSYRRQDTKSPRIADHYVPAGVATALDWTAICHRTDDQPAAYNECGSATTISIADEHTIYFFGERGELDFRNGGVLIKADDGNSWQKVRQHHWG